MILIEISKNFLLYISIILSSSSTSIYLLYLTSLPLLSSSFLFLFFSSFSPYLHYGAIFSFFLSSFPLFLSSLPFPISFCYNFFFFLFPIHASLLFLLFTRPIFILNSSSSFVICHLSSVICHCIPSVISHLSCVICHRGSRPFTSQPLQPYSLHLPFLIVIIKPQNPTTFFFKLLSHTFVSNPYLSYFYFNHFKIFFFHFLFFILIFREKKFSLFSSQVLHKT